ncbi:hypothetical protein BFG57_02850 [Bacillus solimangrovi]|uniref:ABC transmembrane type-1 domain-containing protein n=2 Tax=Bacillus solimangrovi TaxID=1305675 RepID=A0A1E5LDY2_9BACI|nr:hypothetical protein BFG57_02850 [Bacillus solimangrovi]
MLMLFIGFPMLYLVISSLTLTTQWPQILPSNITLSHWHTVFSQPQLLSSMRTSLVLTASVVVLNLVLGYPVARILAYESFKGKAIAEVLLLYPILIPVLLIIMGIHLKMIQLGLTDHLLGVIVAHLIPTLPYTIRIMKNGFEKLGKKWEEQSSMLGASGTQTFRHITVPLLKPSIHAAILVTSVISLSQYGITLIIGGGIVTSFPIIFYPFAETANKGVMAAFSLLFAILPLIFIGITELFAKSYNLITNKD